MKSVRERRWWALDQEETAMSGLECLNDENSKSMRLRRDGVVVDE